MLETTAERLCAARRPALRLARQAAGGCGSRPSTPRARQRVPFTTGILIGIGETRAERIEALLALARGARAPRPHPGDHRPELPRQAGHAHGRPPGAVARRAPLDDRGGARPARPAMEHPGAAEPQPRRLPAPARGRHQRLGRRVAGDARPRQPRGAVAAARAARARRRGAAACELAPRLAVYPRVARPRAGCDAAVRPRVLRARRRARARARGRAGRRARRPPVPARFAVLARRGAARAAPRDELGEDGARPAVPARAATSGCACSAAADGLRREVVGDDGHLRRHAQHQLHQHLLLPLRLLRLLEGQARRNLRGPPYLCPRRDRPPLRGGVGPRRHRGLPAGRHPPGLHRRVLPRGRRARSRRACRTCTCTRSRRSRCGRAPRRSAFRSTTSSRELRDAGLGSLPGTAAEILDDEVRAVHLPRQGHDRAVARGHDAAHRAGLRPT